MIVEVLPFVHNIPWCITKGFLFYIIFKWYRNLSLLIKKKGNLYFLIGEDVIIFVSNFRGGFCNLRNLYMSNVLLITILNDEIYEGIYTI